MKTEFGVTRDPDLVLGGFSLWVHGYERPADSSDGNWLIVTAHMAASGAFVEVEGPIVRSDELKEFARQLSSAVETLGGSAELHCMESNLELSLLVGRLGQVDVKVSITPDQFSQSHSFKLKLDQSYLPPVLRACETILERFPVRGLPED